MKRAFHIQGSRSPRPYSPRTIFCDGVGGEGFRDGVDLELSHWIPNRTPPQFKADSSTEICMNFAAAGGLADGFDLVVNNHLDVDGVLSVFVLLSPEVALAHRRTLAQAAEIGDFGSWGERPAQELFQALALLQARLKSAGADAQEAYAQCLTLAHAMLSGEARPEAPEALDGLAEAVARIDSGEIERTEYHARFVHYAIPRRLAERDLGAALAVPEFNDPLTQSTLLPPNARARRDEQRVQLVSVETAGGWYYDLGYPGDSWAETPRRWRAPGVVSAGSSNIHAFEHPPLTETVAALSGSESAGGRWMVAARLSPFTALKGRDFPVVASFLRDDAPAPSALPPSLVAPRLAPAFAA